MTSLYVVEIVYEFLLSMINSISLFLTVKVNFDVLSKSSFLTLISKPETGPMVSIMRNVTPLKDFEILE